MESALLCTVNAKLLHLWGNTRWHLNSTNFHQEIISRYNVLGFIYGNWSTHFNHTLFRSVRLSLTSHKLNLQPFVRPCLCLEKDENWSTKRSLRLQIGSGHSAIRQREFGHLITFTQCKTYFKLDREKKVKIRTCEPRTRVMCFISPNEA